MVENSVKRNRAYRLLPVRIWTGDGDYFDIACPDTNTIFEIVNRLKVSDSCKWELLDGQEVIVKYD